MATEKMNIKRSSAKRDGKCDVCKKPSQTPVISDYLVWVITWGDGRFLPCVTLCTDCLQATSDAISDVLVNFAQECSGQTDPEQEV